jgi:hypothetical protein
MTNATTPSKLSLEAPPFAIGEIESIEPPVEGAGKYWCRYTIVQGSNTINGMRQGGVKAVKKAVGEIVADMNQRRMGKRGRVHLTPPSKPKANSMPLAKPKGNSTSPAKRKAN